MLNFSESDFLDIVLINLRNKVTASDHRLRFILVLKGRLLVQAEDDRFECVERDVFMVEPGMSLTILEPDENVTLIFEIEVSYLAQYIADYHQIRCHFWKYPSQDYGLLIQAMAKTAKGFFGDSEQDRMMMLAGLYQFIFILSSLKAGQDQDEANPESPGSKTLNRNEEIRRFIIQHANQALTMKDLADHFQLTPQYFSSYFKQNFDTNFVNYLREIRLERAEKELLRSDNSITQIAYNTGFPNLSAFNNAFKEKFTLTPMRYKQLKLQEQSLSPSAYIAELTESESLNQVEQRKVAIQLNEWLKEPQGNSQALETLPIHTIAVNCSVAEPFIKPYFDVINLGFAAKIMSNEFQKQLSLTLRELNFKYARFQNIFDAEIIDRMPETNSYNFSKANRIIDFLYSLNLLPFFELGSKPRKVNISRDKFLFYADQQTLFDNLEEWRLFLQSFFANCINRYGEAEVVKWKFEFWLSHGPVLEYTEDRIADFLAHFAIFHQVIKSLLPGSQVGGFGFNLSAVDYSVLTHVLENLKAQAIHLDFLTLISFHVADHTQGLVDKPLFTIDSEYMSKKSAIIRTMIQKLDLPVILAEWNFDFSSRNYVNDSMFEALFITKNLLENSYFYQSVGYWLLSDISSEYKDTSRILFGGNGLLTVDSIRKPGYFAYYFLSRLGSHVVERDPGYIITMDARDTYQILIYHYVHPSDFFCYKYETEPHYSDVNSIFDPVPAKNQVVTLENIRAGRYRIKKYVLSRSHGSIIDEWIKMGAIENITPSEIDYFNSITIPSQSIDYLQAETKLQIHDIIEPNEIHFYSVRLER